MKFFYTLMFCLMIGCVCDTSVTSPASCDDSYEFVCEGDVYCVRSETGEVLVDQLGNDLIPVCTRNGPGCRGWANDYVEVQWDLGDFGEVICVE